jgi:hypothetical protein
MFKLSFIFEVPSLERERTLNFTVGETVFALEAIA